MNKVHCVLLVDDDYTSNYLSQMIIEGADFADHIHVSENGAEALRFIEESCNDEVIKSGYSCPDLILLDINMPVMDGFGFLEAFQRMSRVRKDNISVVMLTSSSNRTDMERARQYNITGYLDKPLTEEKIKSLADMRK
jgi:CheY-like chemotaxis protein